jgi:hypothetical protein
LENSAPVSGFPIEIVRFFDVVKVIAVVTVRVYCCWTFVTTSPY